MHDNHNPLRTQRVSDKRHPLLCRFLLSGDSTAWTLTGPGVGTRPLTPDGKPAAVTESAVASDVEKTLDVHRHLASEHTFDPVSFLDHRTELVDLILGEIMHAG